MIEPYYADDLVTLYLGTCIFLPTQPDVPVVDAWLRADALVTDPPYGMAFLSNWKTEKALPIQGDEDATLRDRALEAWGGKPWAAFGTWKVNRPADTSQVLIWDKTDGIGPGMGDLGAAFGTSHEEIYLSSGWRKVRERRGSVIRTSQAMGNPHGLVARTGHPTPKPVGMMEVLVASAPGALIADPFAGSGSTLIAARNLGRPSIGVEIEERYCEIAAKRLAQQAFSFEGVE